MGEIHSLRRTTGAAVALALAVFVPATIARAFELGTSQNIGAQAVLTGTPSGGSVESILNTGGAGTRSDPYLFDWGNKDGSGADASTNLVLRGFRIYDNATNNTKSFVLNLNGGSITGDTSVGAIALDMTPGGTNSYYPGHITISNVGQVVMGKILTSRWASPTNPAGNTAGGNVTIGHASRRAGDIRVGSIDAHGDAFSSGRTAGDVAVQGTGSVWIASDEGAGDILTYNTRGANRCGNITLTHDGALVAGALDTGSRKGSANPAGLITLNGDCDNSGPAGPATITRLTTGNPGAGYAGSVAIQGYRSVAVLEELFAASAAYEAGSVSITRIGAGGVSLRGISTYQSNPDSSCNPGAGSVTITNVVGEVNIRGGVDAHSACASNAASAGSLRVRCGGSIWIDGAIDLGHAHTAERRGVLALTATDWTALIRVGALDLGKVRSATFAAGRGHSVIRHALLNFPVNAPADGTLDAAAGQIVHYDASVPANAYLANGAGGVYTLKSGGILTPEPAPKRGTLVTVY